MTFTRQELSLPTMQSMVADFIAGDPMPDTVDMAHYDEIERRQAVAGHLRQVKCNTGVGSKTSKGFLSTTLRADGSISHEWSN